MKFQNPSLNSVLTGRTDGRTDERTSRNQYAPHFFKVGGIKSVHKTMSHCSHCSPAKFFVMNINLLRIQ